MRTILLITLQLLDRLHFLHDKGFIHRDLKPENILVGLGNKSNTVYIIDYGLSKRYIDPHTGEHVPLRTGKALTGTPRFSSVNTHLGFETSRRDDLESLMYIVIYLARGSLPWQGLHVHKGEDRYKKILNKKKGHQLRSYVRDFLMNLQNI